MAERPSDPASVIRAALDYGGDYMPTQDVKDAAYVALARLEREAAERETALERAMTAAEAAIEKGNAAADGWQATQARVREVEAERDEAHKKIGEDRETRWTMQRHLDVAAERLAEYEATVARQAEALREIAERGSDEAGWWNADVARAVLASPEAPRAQVGDAPGAGFDSREASHSLASPEAAAAEPRARVCKGSTRHTRDCPCAKCRAAALPAVDAPPEPTT